MITKNLKNSSSYYSMVAVVAKNFVHRVYLEFTRKLSNTRILMRKLQDQPAEIHYKHIPYKSESFINTFKLHLLFAAVFPYFFFFLLVGQLECSNLGLAHCYVQLVSLTWIDTKGSQQHLVWSWTCIYIDQTEFLRRAFF